MLLQCSWFIHLPEWFHVSFIPCSVSHHCRSCWCCSWSTLTTSDCWFMSAAKYDRSSTATWWKNMLSLPLQHQSWIVAQIEGTCYDPFPNKICSNTHAWWLCLDLSSIESTFALLVSAVWQRTTVQLLTIPRANKKPLIVDRFTRRKSRLILSLRIIDPHYVAVRSAWEIWFLTLHKSITSSLNAPVGSGRFWILVLGNESGAQNWFGMV